MGMRELVILNDCLRYSPAHRESDEICRSSGKTCALLNTIGQCHAWKPFKHVYLMSPNNETVRKGEYGVLDDVACLDHWPTLDYFALNSVLIADDLNYYMVCPNIKRQRETQGIRHMATPGATGLHHLGTNQECAVQES